MKTLNKLFIAILAFGLITGSACKKDETADPNDNNNNNQQFNTGNGSLSCKIDGVDYQFDLEFCADLDGTLNLGNFLENDAQLQYTPSAVGTFDLVFGGQGIHSVLFLVLNDGTFIAATSGTITINELGGTTNGTFEATCTDAINSGTQYAVTNGSFSANLF